MRTFANLLFLLLLCLSPASAQEPSVTDSVDRDYSGELPRIAPLEPDEAMRAFDVVDGFRIELVAAEPLVMDPVAFAFDARNRLFVVEMRGYSEQPDEHLGRVALLTDSDGDGQMDRRSEFVTGLSWPTAVWPWKDGVVVAHAPWITWFRDTDGDGVSDQREDWFEGFGRGNVQGLVNSLRWNIDGLLHGATSSSGAELTRNSEPQSDPIVLSRRDFAIDPNGPSLTARSGGGQHGLSFNRWGDKFVTSNSDHLQQILDLEQALKKAPMALDLPSLRRSIATDGPQAEVFRISPVEPWRIVRTRLRVSGVVPGIVEGGGRAAGYFTGATGTWIVDSECRFGVRDLDTALICDVGSNLIHRKSLTDQGIFWQGNRIDQDCELVRSRDTWFRPVQLGDGPDGAVYIADMYREVIEHPKSLPTPIKKHLDLTSGRDRGRIYRLVLESADRHPPRPLADKSSTELVGELEGSIRWRRNMASQLLIQRWATEVAPQLAQLCRHSQHATARMAALHLLRRFDLLDAETAKRLLADPHERVVEQAVRVVGQSQLVTELSDTLLSCAGQAQPARVQLELILAAAQMEEPKKQRMAQQLIEQANDRVVMAALVSLDSSGLWQRLASDAWTGNKTRMEQWLRLALPSQISSDGAAATFVRAVRNGFSDSREFHREIWIDTTASLSLKRHCAAVTGLLTPEQRRTLTQQVESMLKMDSPSPRLVRRLRLLDPTTQVEWITRLLTPAASLETQLEIVELATWSESTQAMEQVISQFSRLTPPLQRAALRGMIGRESSATMVAEAIESGAISLGQIPVDVRDRLRSFPRSTVADRFKRLLSAVDRDRESVIDSFEKRLDVASAVASDGRKVFEKSCAQCHRLGETGHDVGPPLKQLRLKTDRQLLVAILDPNREVDPAFASYNLLLEDGQVLSGIIREEDANSLTVVEAGGKSHRLRRSELAEVRSSRVSLMPAGLEQQVTPKEMSSLLKFLKEHTPD